MKFAIVTAAALVTVAAVLGCVYSGRPVVPDGGAEPSGKLPQGSSRVGIHPGGIGIRAVLKPSGKNQLASFSAGCFWGVEDYFRAVKGVVATAVGYTGGHTVNPTYEQVCTDKTGHAESVLIEFDPSKVSYEQLLQVFWDRHDPTTLNNQGPDYGTQYRSAIWCYGPEEEQQARASLAAEQKRTRQKIVTEIHQAMPFYLAEEYHQQYDQKTGHACPILHRHGGG